mmetsp:Transcript_7803/g.9761  ORF Transcript_7803/g.9761 Transcript_7803/m.9761 type:complete len:80 (+) Transcript_7803:6-245(+)|eukprot:CAMPEP_0185745414 /NCGR_PEP_ID=MMETSP1174-20130828/3743_1 /TAXON_ID=35687 /ORGANISM="Dictyocha speculum, Strain CCMP1381" /LENGTH=79 /DNA_ID=CAMNT_0028419397 /DNA_START=1 /DNA_END=240 /DNA_ORIENTATION=+
MRAVFLGPPSSGKGTYAKHCARFLGVPHVSTGDLIRAEITAGSPMGLQAASFSEAGHLIPDSIVYDVVERWTERDGLIT